jgi:small-conductance mechanosensitive channel
MPLWQQDGGSGIQLDSALLLGLGALISSLFQAVWGVVKEHRQGEVQQADKHTERLDKRLDGLLERQDAEIVRLDADRDECRQQLDEAFRQIVELRARVLEINTRWGEQGPWNERDERRIRNLLDGD